MNHEPTHDAHSGHGSTEAGGLAVSVHGYTLKLDSTIFASGRQTAQFRVNGPDGLPVTQFQTVHDKELHFVAVRRDTTGFQHTHPVMDSSGTWSIELNLTPGDWRFFADFQPVAHAAPMTLGIDASVAGDYVPHELSKPSPHARLGDYTVALEGDLMPVQPSGLSFTVTRLGEPVTDLEPYLAAYGHLIALRVGDLGYLHVHPEGDPADGITAAGPEISFTAVAPSPGAYRLYLDFQHAGTVRTAEFTVTATGDQADPPRNSSQSHPDATHHHH